MLQLLLCDAIGILGTKEYRKPEWVTHMEEMKTQLQGKERTLSLDSLEHVVVRECDNTYEDEEEMEPSLPGGSFYLLPPITELSEPSSSESERQMSSSCQNLATFTAEFPRARSQSFPRATLSRPAHHSMFPFPLEPRELDPDTFHQLHTADSCEELQEFLLLESQCMSVDTGLAHAFLSDQ
ncbi:uncharacterized protein LOC128995651 [Macrosteles quadrilineatus]|uniref:uncharacterized protein LOC128995651 n=1 Tax=Macrosteles quadrilineatus TaxID=74068 RepID=UPI0023E32884|nr:uncharacterized protein LOC128995651 [Macrosteles quadrilineatus]